MNEEMEMNEEICSGCDVTVNETAVEEIAVVEETPKKTKTGNPYSIFSLILGLFGMAFGGQFLYLPSFISIVLGVMGLDKANACGKGKGLCKAGIICSIISIVWAVIRPYVYALLTIAVSIIIVIVYYLFVLVYILFIRDIFRNIHIIQISRLKNLHKLE